MIYLTCFRKGLSCWRMQWWGNSQTLASLFHPAPCWSHTVSLGWALTGAPARLTISRSYQYWAYRAELTRKADIKNQNKKHTHLEEIYVQWKGRFTYWLAACMSLSILRASLSPTKPEPALLSLPYVNRWTLRPFKLQCTIIFESYIFLNWTGAW